MQRHLSCGTAVLTALMEVDRRPPDHADAGPAGGDETDRLLAGLEFRLRGMPPAAREALGRALGSHRIG